MMRLILYVLTLGITCTANAYDRGDKLLWACEAETNTIEGVVRKSHCIGYLQGIMDGVQSVFGLKPASKFFCPPSQGISGDQMVRIVVKYLRDHPSELHESARSSVILAYMQSFPCKGT
jgi:hypothetical protein